MHIIITLRDYHLSRAQKRTKILHILLLISFVCISYCLSSQYNSLCVFQLKREFSLKTREGTKLKNFISIVNPSAGSTYMYVKLTS